MLPLISLLILLAFTPPTNANPHQVIEAAHRPHPPTIDANLTDWPNALWLEITPKPPGESRSFSRLRTDSNEPLKTAETAADLSAAVALAWNDTAFYLAARVTDNVHDVIGGESHQWYLKDAVTLFLDIPADGDGPGWIEGDHAFSFVADPAYPDDGMWWRRGENIGHLESPAPQGTQMAVQLTPAGYTLEATIPMAALTRITPSWQPPLASRTIGFALVITDADGGAAAFGGQLFYGGSHDDDGTWSLLRLRNSADVSAPYMDVSAEEVDFEARLNLDQRRIKPFFIVDQRQQIPADSTNMQLQLADEYFQTYLDKRPLRFSRRALETAFMLWGNAGAADEIDRALKQIAPSEDVWDKVTSGVRQAFYLQDRLDEGMALLAAIEPQVTPLKSRSALLYTLGQYWLGLEQLAAARHAFTQIVIWHASPWHSGQARRLLRRMDRDQELELDRL